MRPSLNLDWPEPEWLALLRAERARGKSVSQIARETGIARSSVSMLLAGKYPAKSLDCKTRKQGLQITRVYRDQVLCPHLRHGIGDETCRSHATAPMSMSDPDSLRHWAACRRCPQNPVQGGSHGK